MKKVIVIAVVSLLAIAGAIYLDFTSDPQNHEKEMRTYDTGYEDGISIGKEIGYDEGYDEGYFDGMQKAPGKIESRVYDDIWDLCKEIEDKYGIHPEEAIQILANYADDTEAINAEELNRAIWVIFRYYHDSNKIMNGIEDYWID